MDYDFVFIAILFILIVGLVVAIITLQPAEDD